MYKCSKRDNYATATSQHVFPAVDLLLQEAKTIARPIVQ